MHFNHDQDMWRTFSAQDELGIKTKDPWGRVLYGDKNADLVNTPVVSDYLYKNGFRPDYPNNAGFAVCISHDVDHLFQADLPVYDRVKAASKDLFRGRWKRTLHYMNPKDPINPNYNLEELLDTEKRLGIRSTFYFLALRPSEQDYNYSLSDIKPLLKKISESGSEIALHGGHQAYRDEQKMALEKKEIELNSLVSVRGYRNHFLRFATPDTWQNLERTGFSYDSTFGFPDHPGFRNGMCYPFFPYDFHRKQFSKVLEIPLQVMDATFLYYLKYDAAKSLQTILEVVNKTRKLNGVFTLLWHNNYLYKPWDKVFLSIIDYCRNAGAWFAAGDDLNSWWREKNYCSEYSRYGLTRDKE